MTKKNDALIMKAIEAFRDIMQSYYQASASNPTMALSGGMLPFVLLSPFVEASKGAQLAMMGVAGLKSLPSIQLFGGLFSISSAEARTPWPNYMINLKGDVGQAIGALEKLAGLTSGVK